MSDTDRHIGMSDEACAFKIACVSLYFSPYNARYLTSFISTSLHTFNVRLRNFSANYNFTKAAELL